jgi:hypothetical protein
MSAVRILLVLVPLLALALPADAQQNPLMPRIRPVQPGEKLPEQPVEKAEPAAQQAKEAPKPPADPNALPDVFVRGSRVEIKSEGEATNVYFDLNWTLEGIAEPVLQIEGDLLLSDDEGKVHGRVPWTLKDEKGLPARFDERGVGIDTSQSQSAHAWFKGAQPSWIRFGFLTRRVTYVSGRTVECRDCK